MKISNQPERAVCVHSSSARFCYFMETTTIVDDALFIPKYYNYFQVTFTLYQVLMNEFNYEAEQNRFYILGTN